MHPKSPSLSATTVKCLSALPSVLPESLFLKCLRLQQSYVFQTKLLHTLPISFQWGKEVSVGITGFHTYVSLMLLCKSSPLSVLLLIKVNYPAMTCYGHFSFGLLLHGGPATPIACSRFSGTLSLFLQSILSLGNSTSTLVEFIAVGSTKSPVTERAGKPILLQSLVPGILLLRK